MFINYKTTNYSYTSNNTYVIYIEVSLSFIDRNYISLLSNAI